MSRLSRIDFADAIVTLAPVSGGVYLWKFFGYFASHQAKPNAELGLVHALANHGSYVYVSDAEAMGLTLLETSAGLGFFAAYLIVYGGNAKKIDLTAYTNRRKIITLSSMLFWVVFIYFFGSSIAHIVVSVLR
jgi:hypothetical protein